MRIGVNHNGSVKLAKNLLILQKNIISIVLNSRKESWYLCTWFQKEIMRETPWGMLTYLDYKKNWIWKKRIWWNWYILQKKKIKWFASAWDANSQKFLRRYKSKYNKVASAMMPIFILKLVASEKKTFISTGMTKIKDIETVKIFRKSKMSFTLLH